MQHNHKISRTNVETRNGQLSHSLLSGGPKKRWERVSSQLTPPHCCWIAGHLRTIGCQVDLFKEDEFADFRASLDADMKHIQGLGVGTKVHKVEVITIDEEELLLEDGR